MTDPMLQLLLFNLWDGNKKGFSVLSLTVPGDRWQNPHPAESASGDYKIKATRLFDLAFIGAARGGGGVVGGLARDEGQPSCNDVLVVAHGGRGVPGRGAPPHDGLRA